MPAKLKMYPTRAGRMAGALLTPLGGNNPDAFHGERGRAMSENAAMQQAAIALLDRPQGVTGNELADQQEALGGSRSAAAYEWHLRDYVHRLGVDVVKVDRKDRTEYHIVRA